jgi:hypothetical protein
VLVNEKITSELTCHFLNEQEESDTGEKEGASSTRVSVAPRDGQLNRSLMTARLMVRHRQLAADEAAAA